MRSRRPSDPDLVWSKTKVRTVLTVGALAAALVLVGLVLAIINPWSGGATPDQERTPLAGPGGNTATAAAGARRDAIAAAPMKATTVEDSTPQKLSSTDPGTIVLPASSGTGPVAVPAEYPHTVEGAMAQLAAIDQTGLGSASLEGARKVIRAWAEPGGPTTESWSMIGSLASFLSAAEVAAGSAHLAATPMMGQVKGVDGPDWAVVCVNFEIEATLDRTARIGASDCQRMQWSGDRWKIASGSEPSAAPDVWPGSDVAIAAGFKTLAGRS